MTQISASMVKELREKTGAGMMDAKKALQEAEGDLEKAAELLRQKGVASADKKSGRSTAEGAVVAKISADAKRGVLAEVNSETDFVARGEAFQALANQLAETALASNAADAEALKAEPSPTGSGTVEDYLKENIAVIKENLNLRRFVRLTVSENGHLQSYIHLGGKIGVLLALEADKPGLAKNEAFQVLAKDLTLHIASAAPEYVTRNEIPQDVIEEEKRIEMGKEDLQNKPVEIREKIVTGRIDKLLAQRVLLEQPFVKDPGKTITELVQEVSSQVGATISVNHFVRYLLGEGVEKRQDNFAEEVMAQMKS